MNLTGGVFERAFLEHLTGIAASGGTHKSNETAMKILLHSCHSWQWASRVCIFVLLDLVRTEEATSGVAPRALGGRASRSARRLVRLSASYHFASWV